LHDFNKISKQKSVPESLYLVVRRAFVILQARSEEMNNMQPLEKMLRNKLERTIREARDIAEAAARASLEQLGVGEANPHPYLSEEERSLRVRLRAHGRQQGDLRDFDGRQETSRLIEEVAYQHWHRMLFACFLAENNLLMYPDPIEPIPVTLEECDDLAAGEGAKDGWELAARFAARMLPQIFRPDSPVFQLSLPPEHQQRLERLLSELPTEVFTASDSIGWVYQFWQAKRKDEINAAEVKIGSRELPVVTQLFTEPYMVSFLLDNSLGAWWAARSLSEEDLKNANDEEELRGKAALPGVPLDYLRFVHDDSGRWMPAAGAFAGWPQRLKDLKVLDPCCGSGHFLVAALPLLASMRALQEGLSAREAVDAVLRENLHGLEIDQRCVELAAFALALAAWLYPDAGGYRKLPDLNLACSGLAIGAKKEEWQSLARRANNGNNGNNENNGNNKNDDNQNLEIVLGDIYDQFKDAPFLGSLINPRIKLFEGNILGLQWDDVFPLLKTALSSEADTEKAEMGVVAQGLIKAAQLLSRRYHLVITNVPYLTRGKQGLKLKSFCEGNFNEGKNDLATAFFVRCIQFCKDLGSASCVLPQNWLFLSSYRKLREELLKKEAWHLIARLGEGGFESSAAAGAFTILIILSRTQREIDESQTIAGLDVSASRTASEKAAMLRTSEIKRVGQARQLENPDARVALENGDTSPLLLTIADGIHGFGSKDSPRFFRQFWEIISFNDDWQLMQTTIENTSIFGGMEQAVYWQKGCGLLAELGKIGLAIPAGGAAWGKKGIAISQMRNLPCCLYFGDIFDKNVAVILPKIESNIPAIWCFCSSPEYNEAVRQIDQSLKVTNATLVKVPFDLDRWQKVAAERYPNGLPKPYSNDPTQWIFHGHPAQSDAPLQVAVARLLGYRWPAEMDPQMELSEDAREWIKKCSDLLAFADDDGIVCIPPVRGEASAADCLLDLLANAYGSEWDSNKLSELLKGADNAGKNLESWLRDKFFLQHCRLFHNRPFIWHVWDGTHDGFAALVNYHKLDGKLLESLIYTYLGDWISRQKDDIRNGVDGAEEKLAAAEGLKKRLELILEGDAPYDIFVRWKPLCEQPLGWNPDHNDGVRLNIRPFMSVPDVGRKGAGVLRDRPNVNWNKDRGKDVESAPWYRRFGGDRINDHHLSLKEKRSAREICDKGMGT
jgi:hypothetical protein